MSIGKKKKKKREVDPGRVQRRGDGGAGWQAGGTQADQRGRGGQVEAGEPRGGPQRVRVLFLFEKLLLIII